MNTKANFCKSLDWTIKIVWLDLTGMHDMGDRVARIQLDDLRTCGQYPGFTVSIIHKRDGRIDSKHFRFDDYLDRATEARTDARRDYPHSVSDPCFHVSSHSGWNWYIAVPKSTAAFCAAVETYIGMFGVTA